MGKFSRKANKGKHYRTWHSSTPAVDVPSRQQRRALNRQYRWSKMSGVNLLADEKGIIPRSVRRDMSKFQRRRKGIQ